MYLRPAFLAIVANLASHEINNLHCLSTLQ